MSFRTRGAFRRWEKFGLDVTPQVFSTIKSLTNKKKTKDKKKAAAGAAAPGPKASSKVHSANPADLARQVMVIGIESRSTLGTQSRSTGSTTLACGDDAAAGGQGCVPWMISPGFGRPTGTG